jgi:hypothetical protein
VTQEDRGPDQHEMIRQVREALGLFAGAIPKSPQQVWEESLSIIRSLRLLRDIDGQLADHWDKCEECQDEGSCEEIADSRLFNQQRLALDAARAAAQCTCPQPTFTHHAPSPMHPHGSVSAANLPTLRDIEVCPVHRSKRANGEAS